MVISAGIRRALERHAREEAPNEACGLVLLRDGEAVRYEPGRNAAASPYRFELDVDPELWFAEDEGYELAVFHSHPVSRPRPSRTDIAKIGLWEDRPLGPGGASGRQCRWNLYQLFRPSLIG